MNDVNQFANLDEAAESVDVSSDTEMDKIADTQPSAEADIVTDAAPVELLPEIRIMQLEAELTAQRAKLDELALSAAEQQADLKKRLRDAEIRAELAEQKHGEAGRELFERGRKISDFERRISIMQEDVENLIRRRDNAEMRANAHIAESDGLKAQLLAQIDDNEKLRRINDVLEARLADGAPGIEYDIVQDATSTDLRAAEMTGWSVKHMQFSENGTLRVVLRRNKSQQPRERKPATASRVIPTRPIVPPPAPAHPAPTAQADHVADTGDMVIVGLDDTPEPARADVLREASPSAISDVMQSFARNLKAQFAANPIPSYRPLSDIISSR